VLIVDSHWALRPANGFERKRKKFKERMEKEEEEKKWKKEQRKESPGPSYIFRQQAGLSPSLIFEGKNTHTHNTKIKIRSS
jgi:hypothetical protein